MWKKKAKPEENRGKAEKLEMNMHQENKYMRSGQGKRKQRNGKEEIKIERRRKAGR